MAILPAIFLGSTVQSADNEVIPDDFFQGGIEGYEVTGINPDPEFPIFPILGEPDAEIKIDYFYTYSCEPCATSSRAIAGLLSGDIPVQVTFHNLAQSQADYDAAVAEVVLNTVASPAFEVFHFVKMVSEMKDLPLTTETLLSDILRTSPLQDELEARLANYEGWTASLEHSAMIARDIGVASLPSMVINDELYEGFISEEVFLETIREILP